MGVIELGTYFRCKDITYMPLASYRHDNSMVHISDAKAAEAAQSAYYDPNQPQCAYVPPPAYYVSTA
jgi:hypothetical protein